MPSTLLTIVFCIVTHLTTLPAAEVANITAVPASNSFTQALFFGVTALCKSITESYNTTSDFIELKNTVNLVYISPLKTEYVPLRYAYPYVVSEKLIDFDRDTFVIIHGFNDNPESNQPNSIAKELNKKDKYNIFLLDASKISEGNFLKSAGMIKHVGELLGYLLYDLIEDGLKPERVHLVGLSLGAQISSWTGKYFNTKSGKKLGKITGLDPAGPCFTYADKTRRLDKSDADFVNVIHVNMGVQGIIEAVGHADFYVNGGGPNQPGCWSSACSHERAGLIYAESITSEESFVGTQCQSWEDFTNNKCYMNKISIMGYGIKNTTSGVYYLRTNSKSPFGLGMDDPVRECSPVDLSTTTAVFYSGNAHKEYPLSGKGARDVANDSRFNRSRQTIIFVHGFTRTPNSLGSLAIKDALSHRSNAVNYLAINATDIFSGSLYNIPSYIAAAQNSVCLGRNIGDFIYELSRVSVRADKMYLIGHSLGCPTVGFAARRFTKRTGRKIYRATGLDCVEPCFYPDDDIQLRPDDAQMVDAMHTNMYGFGTASRIGTADFYPNGGYFQKNCLLSIDPMCSHADALFFYSESVTSDSCVGNQIVSWPNLFNLFTFSMGDSTAPMGYLWLNQTGSFYLNTNARSPYCESTPKAKRLAFF